MGDTMAFPASVEEFMEQYKMTDTEHVYSNGTEYVPIYRMKQYFEHCRNQQRPTIDAVPVVRCWECKQGEVDDPDFPDQYYCHAGCGWNNGDFYCAYGEREEGADNG